jgi:hypothetical protein
VSSPVSPSSPLNPVNNPPPAPPPAVAPEVAKEDSPKDPPKTEQKNESKESPKLDVPKGKELVHGFGIVLSLEILNKPIIQQIEITDAFKFDTEINNEFGKNQNLQLELIQLGTSEIDFNSIANSSWLGIRRHNFLQQDGYGN